MNLNNKWYRRIFVAAAVFLPFGGTLAYGDFTVFSNFGSKWGDPTHGLTSDIITWSFMTDGTSLAPGHPLIADGGTGTSNISSLQSRFTSGTFNQTVQNAFNTWSATSNGRVTFQQMADNGSVAGDSNNPNSSVVDIRIGAFTSTVGSNFSFSGAFGYGPPGNDLNVNFRDALAGDIYFNLGSQFFVASGVEGDVFYNGGVYVNDLEGLVLHELGHAAIGLGHSTNAPIPGLGDVMYVDNFPNCCNFINRQLSSQDAAGLRSVYGVPEPNSMILVSMVIGCIAMNVVRKRRTHRIYL